MDAPHETSGGSVMSKAGTLHRLDHAWQDLLASYAGLPKADLLAPGPGGDWSVRDIIAHVTWWEQEALTHLPVILAGERPPRYSVRYGGLDAFNSLKHAQTRGQPLDEVLRRRDQVHERLVAYLNGIPEVHYVGETRFRRRLRLDTVGHYRLHAAAIRTRRAQVF